MVCYLLLLWKLLLNKQYPSNSRSRKKEKRKQKKIRKMATILKLRKEMIHGPKLLGILYPAFLAIKTKRNLMIKKMQKMTRKKIQETRRRKKKTRRKKKKKEAEKKKEKPKEPKVNHIKEPLDFETNIVETIAFSKEQFNSSKEKLNKLDEIDRIKQERETSLNDLESFILNIREKLYEDIYEKSSI